MASICGRSVLLVFLAAGLGQVAKAADAPADPCSLLSAATISSTLGGTYSGPEKSVAPRPFPNTVQGTDCHYSSSHHELLFRIYFDHSATEATDLHAKLKMWFGTGATPASVGDESYFDKNHALHARKGNVRFFITTINDEQKVAALGNVVAGKL